MAREQERHGGRVVDLVGRHGLDEADVVRDADPVWGKPFADRRPALAMAEAGLEGMISCFCGAVMPREALTMRTESGTSWPAPSLQPRFVIEELDLRRSAAERQENGAARFGCKMRQVDQATDLACSGSEPRAAPAQRNRA